MTPEEKTELELLREQFAELIVAVEDLDPAYARELRARVQEGEARQCPN